jgi:hypothetical protein
MRGIALGVRSDISPGIGHFAEMPRRLLASARERHHGGIAEARNSLATSFGK